MWWRGWPALDEALRQQACAPDYQSKGAQDEERRADRARRVTAEEHHREPDDQQHHASDQGALERCVAKRAVPGAGLARWKVPRQAHQDKMADREAPGLRRCSRWSVTRAMDG
jgi:hypothetical protein